METNFRLFNCDHTYNLDKVQALITKVTQKLHVKGTVEQKYFGLPQMKDLCKELDEGGKMAGYAVFVVHAHESTLSLNGEKAGIGYTKLYRTLLSITDGRVLIVIGGDDNYKENEQDQSFLSRWAWRKIFSQFTEEDMNGTKSFIFSWDDNHNPIHEEALEFYLEQNKSGRKFVPRPRPKQVETPAATDPLGLGPSAPQQEPQDIRCSSTVQKGVPGPKVHVILLHHASHHETVMDVFHEIYMSLHFTGVPMLGSMDSKYLSEYCRSIKPDYMVLVSEYGEFMDLRNLQKKLDHLRGLFKIINKSADTKLIFIVTANPSLRKEEQSSDIVDQNALYLNNGILQPGKLMVLSWNQRPCDVHREVLKDQLSRPRDSIKGEYRPIDNGQWISIGGEVPGAFSTHAKHHAFIKIAEVYKNDKAHRSLQAYSYHSSPESLMMARKFFQVLGIQCTPSSKTSLDFKDIVEQIRSRQPEFIVFSTDFDLFVNAREVEEIARSYWGSFQHLIDGLKGIIVLLLGDKDCIDGRLLSSAVHGYVQHFTTLFPMISSKLTVMSWKDKPFIGHQEEMKKLLVRPVIHEPPPRTQRPTEDQYEVTPNPPPITEGLVCDPAKGYLRYRAYLVHGHVHKVLYCYPPGWTPDKEDLDLISRKHAKEPETVLEFWADSPDGLPTTIDVKPVEKKSTFSFPKMPSLPSW